ncbi:MAG: threonine--tRNA ligase [Polyangiaceae bacterium]
MTNGARATARELLEASGQLDADVLAVQLNGKLIDLHTPLAVSADQLKPVRKGSKEALELIRHSTAHVMADAVQRLFPGTQVTIGPAIDSGFYYDFDRPDGPFTDKDLQRIEKEMRKIIKSKRPFTRETVSRAEALELFDGMGEKYKRELIEGLPQDAEISLYRHGSPGRPEGTWVDLCAGPHVPSTADLGVVKLTSVAGAYWRGDEKRPMLQRIYGTAFPTQEELDAYLTQQEEAKKRDHRKLGKELELFWFHEYAPAMPFFLPRGAAVYRRLVEYIRNLYVDYGYQEVITPQIFDKRLFETSGHLQNYRENMYLPVTAEAIDQIAHDHAHDSEAHPALESLAQKPMNCPSHCLIFGQRKRSYRELPWRIADFGRLHRYERGGSLHGLARVRTFCQDDAHIFCTPEQMRTELESFNKLLFEVYSAFRFENVQVKLALRPEKRVGTDAMWDAAEKVLEDVLKETGVPYEVLPGEGAFYGPKLEFHITDALGRDWQLGTMQVDYALPERFDLEYVDNEGQTKRPVMLHRAILGSVERFFGVYIEHCAGKFPMWLAPEQISLLTVSEKQAEFAQQTGERLRSHGLRVLVDAGSDKLGAKIRNARNQRLPYFAVIGEQEVENNSLSVRSRDEGELGSLPIDQFIERAVAEAAWPRA